MKLQPAVKKETAHIALGVAVGVAVMLAVFALLGRFDYTVALGGVLGGVVAVANFLLLGLTVQKITNEANAERGQKLMQFSYSMRMLVMALWLILAVSMPFLHWVAAALPLLFPRLTIAVMQLTGVYKKEQNNEEKGEQVDHER